eukprot:CAMPEP_0174257402 /NCGR_PEP_ID=MMETSP0439-20130205/6541_1 /TAXON_ID=0 /ORGANISM="Stereomyxa ramosa, Strain Chinc5" /LENGTH=517 /DNA_ID=CAMNT_0015340473 /DNA_START=1623 /DNA_END=3176 /DNA_ORIENTATION=+
MEMEKGFKQRKRASSIATYGEWGNGRNARRSSLIVVDDKYNPTPEAETNNTKKTDGFRPLRQAQSFATFGEWRERRRSRRRSSSIGGRITKLSFFNQAGRLPVEKSDTAFLDKLLLFLFGCCYTLQLDGEKLEKKKHLRPMMNIIGWFIGTMPELEVFLNRRFKHQPLNIFFYFAIFMSSCLRGSGQVLFLNNPLTGLIILGSLFIDSAWLGFCSILGLFFATLFAFFLGINMQAIRSGIFGFNGLLLGAGFSVFLDGEWRGEVVALVIVTSLFSTIVQLALANLLVPTLKVSPFTMPFNVILLTVLVGAYGYKHVELPDGVMGVGVVDDVDGIDIEWDILDFIKGALRGISQVYVSADWIVGLVMWIAISVCSPISFLFAMLGSITGMGVGFALGAPSEEIYQGLWGYNGVLTSIAVGGMFYMLNYKTTILAILSSLLATFFFGALKTSLSVWGLPAATLAFVFSAWVFVMLQGSIHNVISIPLTSVTTPEGHLRRYVALLLVNQKTSRGLKALDV